MSWAPAAIIRRCRPTRISCSSAGSASPSSASSITCFPERGATLLARLHFWLAEASYIVFVIALYLIFSGQPDIGEPIAGGASIGLLLSMVLFGLVALPVLRGAR
jgi:hypothetical protein